MYTCSFFGHRDAPETIEPILMSVLRDMIKSKKVDTFYVGNNGNFDRMVRKKLKILKNENPGIKYYIVLAYMPMEKRLFEDYSDTIYPDGLENTPPRFAIDKRNKWMIEHSDYVITYVIHSFGGAAKYKKIAENRGIDVINLDDIK